MIYDSWFVEQLPKHWRRLAVPTSDGPLTTLADNRAFLRNILPGWRRCCAGARCFRPPLSKGINLRLLDSIHWLSLHCRKGVRHFTH
jgi:hypothetical protein